MTANLRGSRPEDLIGFQTSSFWRAQSATRNSAPSSGGTTAGCAVVCFVHHVRDLRRLFRGCCTTILSVCASNAISNAPPPLG